jgi:hypothetical protein
MVLLFVNPSISPYMYYSEKGGFTKREEIIEAGGWRIEDERKQRKSAEISWFSLDAERSRFPSITDRQKKERRMRKSDCCSTSCTPTPSP